MIDTTSHIHNVPTNYVIWMTRNDEINLVSFKENMALVLAPLKRRCLEPLEHFHCWFESLTGVCSRFPFVNLCGWRAYIWPTQWSRFPTKHQWINSFRIDFESEQVRAFNHRMMKKLYAREMYFLQHRTNVFSYTHVSLAMNDNINKGMMDKTVLMEARPLVFLGSYWKLRKPRSRYTAPEFCSKALQIPTILVLLGSTKTRYSYENRIPKFKFTFHWHLFIFPRRDRGYAITYQTEKFTWIHEQASLLYYINHWTVHKVFLSLCNFIL
jgi:hypothetical protein